MKSLLDQAGSLDRATREERTQVKSNYTSTIFHLDIWISVDREAKSSLSKSQGAGAREN